LVITSAGCNALDYALAGAGRIHSVDANPRQTALLELKLAGIRRLDFDDFFQVFGEGHHPRFRELLQDCLRQDLSPFAAEYWTRNADWFDRAGPGGFYYHGLSGVVARGFRLYLRLRPRLDHAVSRLMEARCVDSQRAIYDEAVSPHLWSAGMNWTLSRQITMSLLGVPYPQRREVQSQHANGVAGFIRESIEYVFRQLPVWTNYFWTLYLRGRYTRDCCPEYLRRENFLALKGGLAERIHPHTCTVTDFLQGTEERFSRFVLLDHMDWMSSYHPEALVEEWQAILGHATPDARIIFRSAHAAPRYLGHLRLAHRGRSGGLRDFLVFHPTLAGALQRQDRVHTYAGFHIADVSV
jgi:S-adenosylmethionine-diacylglycerol 3-amino-3-carboxypropyl transferase